MNLAALQRFAPLLSLGNRTAGSLSDGELTQVAGALSGSDPAPLLGLFKVLRDSEPDTLITNLLGSPGAKSVLEKLQESNQQKQNHLFCTCPNCGFSFETELL